jgi:hypothetical protein
MNDWTDDIEIILEDIRVNCVILTAEHKKMYFSYKNFLQYFRLPIIVISGINSIISVGFQEYMEQSIISMVTCLLALVCSIIASIEMYLAIQKSMEQSLIANKEFYLLGVDIQKTLLLERQHRPVPAKDFLEKCYNMYVKLTENSNVLDKKLTDKLTPIPTGIELTTPKSFSMKSIKKPIINYLEEEAIGITINEIKEEN